MSILRSTVIVPVLLICSGRAGAGLITVVLTPTRDAEIRFQSGVFLQVAETEELSSVQGYSFIPGPLLEQRSALEFDLSAIPTSGQLVSATLSLHDRNAGLSLTSSSSIEIHGYAGDGTIGLPDATVSDLIAGPFTNPAQSLPNLNVTSFLQALRADDEHFAGFLLKQTTPPLPGDRPSGFVAWSTRAMDLNVRPTITVIYAEAIAVPEPTSFALFGCGFAAMLMCAWQKTGAVGAWAVAPDQART